MPGLRLAMPSLEIRSEITGHQARQDTDAATLRRRVTSIDSFTNQAHARLQPEESRDPPGPGLTCPKPANASPVKLLVADAAHPTPPHPTPHSGRAGGHRPAAEFPRLDPRVSAGLPELAGPDRGGQRLDMCPRVTRGRGDPRELGECQRRPVTRQGHEPQLVAGSAASRFRRRGLCARGHDAAPDLDVDLGRLTGDGHGSSGCDHGQSSRRARAGGLRAMREPAPGDLTVGGVMATGAHGSAIPATGETPLPGQSYGSLSNLILSLTAAAWSPSHGRVRRRPARVVQGVGRDSHSAVDRSRHSFHQHPERLPCGAGQRRQLGHRCGDTQLLRPWQDLQQPVPRHATRMIPAVSIKGPCRSKDRVDQRTVSIKGPCRSKDCVDQRTGQTSCTHSSVPRRRMSWNDAISSPHFAQILPEEWIA